MSAARYLLVWQDCCSAWQVWILSGPWEDWTASRPMISRAGADIKIFFRSACDGHVTRCVNGCGAHLASG